MNERDYLLIPRTELPKTEIVERDGRLHVDTGSDSGTWPITVDPASVRKWGLEYLAAAEAIEKHQTEAKTAEAEDAAKLDAEADALRMAIYGGDVGVEITAFDQISSLARDKYRRAARKARELHDRKAQA